VLKNGQHLFLVYILHFQNYLSLTFSVSSAAMCKQADWAFLEERPDVCPGRCYNVEEYASLCGILLGQRLAKSDEKRFGCCEGS